MDVGESFETLWHRHDDFQFGEPEPNLCPYAQRFSTWAEELLTGLAGERNVVSVNQSKVLLLDKYFEWRSAVPKSHRYHLGRANGHVCIFHVFETAYERLKVLELSLTPPLLFLPAPPPPPPQIAGIFIGQEEQ